MGTTDGTTRGRSCRKYALVEFSGELDISEVDRLRAVLGAATRTGRSVIVDLSRVTFIDALCLRELIVHQQLHAGRLALCRPSAQVEVSVLACELEGWTSFHPDIKDALRSMTEKVSDAPIPGWDRNFRE